MPNEPAGDPGNRASTIADLAETATPGSVDGRHLLLVGAGPGLGMAVARRFAVGGYRVTLVARSPDRLRDLAGTLAGTGAKISTIAADASDPDGLGARMRGLYLGHGAPGVIVYNAVMGAPDRLLSSSVAHLQAAYSVDVISAIVVAQVAAPAMRAAGSGTILVTGGGFADHPIPALATVSLGKAALRPAATMPGADLEPDGIRVATLTIAGTIAAGRPASRRGGRRSTGPARAIGPGNLRSRSRCPCPASSFARCASRAPVSSTAWPGVPSGTLMVKVVRNSVPAFLAASAGSFGCGGSGVTLSVRHIRSGIEARISSS
jgi:short-subunit dehydrogenase